MNARNALRALTAATAAIDFLLWPLASAVDGGMLSWLMFEPLVIGLLLGQIVGLAMWLVWGEGTFVRRLIVHWVVGLGLMAAVLLGVAATMAGISWPVDLADVSKGVAVIVCALSVLSLAAQLPLWPLRAYFGWCVERQNLAVPAHSQPLSIRDLLLGTGVVGVTLGLARAILRFDNVGYVWAELGMAAFAAFLASLLIGLPATICVLRSEDLLKGGVVLGGYLAVGLLLVVGVPCAYSATLPPIEALFALLIVLLAFTATLAAPLLVLRASGYRLKRPRDRRGNIASAAPH